MNPFIMLIYNILGFLLIVATFEPSNGLYLGRRYVHIRNDLENHVTLRIHCWSRDNDLGFKTLYPNQETTWTFVDNYIWGTKFACNMEYFQSDRRMKRGNFVVYNNKRSIRTRECHKRCAWSVRKYGLYAYDEKDKRWDYETPWPSKNRY